MSSRNDVNTTVWNDVITTAVSSYSDITCYNNDVTGNINDAINDAIPNDEEDGILSEATFRVVEKILDCGCRPFFFFIGAPTNLLNMIVFFRQGLRDRMNLCLFSLAFIDLMYVTSKFVMSSYCFVSEDNFMLRELWKYTVRKFAVNFVFSFLYSSGCLTMTIAVERCVCVVFPMKAATIMKTRTMAMWIVFTVIFMNAVCLCYALKYDVVTFNDVTTGKFVVMLGASSIYKSHKVIMDVIENIVLTVITFVNFIIVSVATCITVIKLRNAMTWRQQSGSVKSAEKRQVTLVKMLVTLSCIYIICTVPTICVALTRLLVPDFWAQSRYRRMYFVTHIAATVILMFNSSVNFVVYIRQSSRFRAELRVLFFGDKTKTKSAPSGSHTANCSSAKTT